MRNLRPGIVHCIALPIVALALAFTAQAQTYTYSVLYSFKNNGNDPQNADAALIVDGSGNLYGTSFSGGSSNLGTVFKVTKSGKMTVLHNFQGGNSDGNGPSASLMRDSVGNLYGTTKYGGNLGYGVVFELSSTNQETILYSGFDGNIGVTGSAPNNVVRDSAGNLYGTTQGGGIYQEGLAFKIDTNNNFSILHNFCSTGYPFCPDGGNPQALITTGGNLYGTTGVWGAIERGTVYEMTPDGVITTLHSFGGTYDGGDGMYPNNSLRQDAKANVYGSRHTVELIIWAHYSSSRSPAAQTPYSTVLVRCQTVPMDAIPSVRLRWTSRAICMASPLPLPLTVTLLFGRLARQVKKPFFIPSAQVFTYMRV